MRTLNKLGWPIKDYRSQAIRCLLMACLTVTLVGPAAAEIHFLALTSVTDFTSTAVKPGGLASVWCSGLTNIAGVISEPGPVFPTQVAGVSVVIQGRLNAPILAVADLGGYQLINIQVPWEAGVYSGIAVTQGGERGEATVFNSAQWPVFFMDPGGYIVARHAADYSLVTLTNPAQAGEWIAAYASNLGPVTNTPPTGVMTPVSPLSIVAPVPPANVSNLPSFSILVPNPGGVVGVNTPPTESNFIGLAPYTLGVYQLNFRVPEGLMNDAMVYVRSTVDCGFFFVAGCGRGPTATVSTGAKLPVKH